MANAKWFTKPNANRGYWQIPLDKESQLLTTFNTPFGRYCYQVTPFVITSAQEVFKKRMSQHFGDLEGVETDIDDIIVHAEKEVNMTIVYKLSWNGMRRLTNTKQRKARLQSQRRHLHWPQTHTRRNQT